MIYHKHHVILFMTIINIQFFIFYTLQLNIYVIIT